MIIENITYINLEKRLDKKLSIEKQLKTISSKINTFRTEGVVVDLSEIDNLSTKNKELLVDKNIFLNTAGCYLAHINAIKNIQKSIIGPKNYSLIMEDDIIIDPKFWQIVSALEVPSDADVVFFDNIKDKVLKQAYSNILHLIPHNNPSYCGAFCYAIRHNRVNKILQKLTSNKQINHVDMKLYHSNIKTYSFITNTINVDFNFGSDRLNCKTHTEILNKIDYLSRLSNT